MTFAASCRRPWTRRWHGGFGVMDVGRVPPPLLYFAASTLCASGIQVTGSHNPRDYNGFKMVLAGRTIHGEEIQGLRRCMEQESWQLRPGGSVRHADVLPAYHERIVGDVRLARPMKIVLDCGNGIAGASTPALLRALGCEVIELFSQVDGNFPNHHPDPSKPENLRDLIAALQGSDAELGLALDGHGDRLGIVTRDGHNIFADRQLMLLAQDVLARVPGAEIIFDVKCSQRLAPAIEAAGGVPVMHQTGHSLIKARMQQGNAPLGGEMSGHIFFKERWYGFDDGSSAGCRLLEILSRSSDPSACLDALPASFSTPELNVDCAEGEAHRLSAQLQALAAQLPWDAQARVSTIDGLRIDWPDGFALIRASTTTPVLVLRFEGHDRPALARIEAAMLALLHRVKPEPRLRARPGHAPQTKERRTGPVPAVDLVHAAAAAAQTAPPRRGRARLCPLRGRALWPISAANRQPDAAQHRSAGPVRLGACGLSGRDPGGGHLAGAVARTTARDASAAHPWRGHGPRRRQETAANRRCAGLAALGYARRRGALSAQVPARRRHPDGNRGLAQSGGRLLPAGGAAGAGQRAPERKIAAPGAVAGSAGATGLRRTERRLGANRCRRGPSADHRRQGARRVRQPEVRRTARCRSTGARPCLARANGPSGAAAGQQPCGRGSTVVAALE